MKIETFYNDGQNALSVAYPKVISKNSKSHLAAHNDPPEILFITSYPPRECGIANYSQDLVKALKNKFKDSFAINVCALESGNVNHLYPPEVKYILDTNFFPAYHTLAKAINSNKLVKIVLVQHEFGFYEKNENDFLNFLKNVTKPKMVVFHTVLPRPDEALTLKVKNIVAACESIVVMTNSSKQILISDYDVADNKITVIAHGTHLVPHLDKDFLKEKYGMSGRKVLSTFGLLSSGKGIETTLGALSAIVKKNPNTLFLIIGKTHPGVVSSEGEIYRSYLESKVEEMDLYNHVKFINRYIQLPDLLEYLQLTDIYLFTSRDPNQAVSGTFSYAVSCGCPIISTPIPHAREVLKNDAGTIIDFDNSHQLTEAVNTLLNDDELRKNTSSNGLHLIAPSAWENAAIAHAMLFEKMADGQISLNYTLPPINLDHLIKMTTNVGMIQFSKINKPDIESGYTLDDNARAMIALCMHYELTGEEDNINYLNTYLNFIKYCQQDDGSFLNYVDAGENFTLQNNENLSDANGRAIWALGFLISKRNILPAEMVASAEDAMVQLLPHISSMHSTRAMAFAIKGLYYFNTETKATSISNLINTLANRLVQMYRHESETGWEWYESYLTYANSLLPEAMLYAWLETGDINFKETAKASFDFLLTLTFKGKGIKVISNKSWLH
ncbi:MAG: glycosyltransferase, partial [Bacteroidia bacterium]